MKRLGQKFFYDDNGQPAVWQTPNLPLIIWLAATIASRFLHGPWQSGLRALAIASLLVWSALEVGRGASYFRRFLGLVVLIGTIATVFRSKP